MRALVTGGTSGIGEQVALLLKQNNVEVLTLANDEDADIQFDLKNYIVLKRMAGQLPVMGIDILINCAGTNLLKKHEDLTPINMHDLINVNALSGFFLAEYLNPRICCSIVSDAAWTPMTHSAAYNASKAAQHMLIRQMAHENRDRITFGVAPGKVHSTGMSDYIDKTFPPMRGMTYEEGREYQVKGLRTGEMSPIAVAEFICMLVFNANVHYNGHIFPIGG